MPPTTMELITEAADLLGKSERALARLSRRMPILVKGIIANGDAAALGAMRQMKLQALAHAAPGAAYLQIVELHETLYAAEIDAGISDLPPPDGGEDITIQSSGR